MNRLTNRFGLQSLLAFLILILPFSMVIASGGTIDVALTSST